MQGELLNIINIFLRIDTNELTTLEYNHIHPLLSYNLASTR